MCGIVGFVSDELQQERGQKALNALAHRGPDFGDFISEKAGAKSLFLGHRRLAIIDLSDSGNQPMHQGGVSIAFNGEIYNYRELKRSHLGGEPFTSSSDTEVLLKLYLKFGMDFTKHIKGDFAIALLDRNQNQLVLVRDRIGVKPLYIYEGNGVFAFASEIKAFREAGLPLHIREDGLGKFLVFKYSPGQETLYAEVRRLPPGSAIQMD